MWIRCRSDRRKTSTRSSGRLSREADDDPVCARAVDQLDADPLRGRGRGSARTSLASGRGSESTNPTTSIPRPRFPSSVRAIVCPTSPAPTMTVRSRPEIVGSRLAGRRLASTSRRTFRGATASTQSRQERAVARVRDVEKKLHGDERKQRQRQEDAGELEHGGLAQAPLVAVEAEHREERKHSVSVPAAPTVPPVDRGPGVPRRASASHTAIGRVTTRARRSPSTSVTTRPTRAESSRVRHGLVGPQERRAV